MQRKIPWLEGVTVVVLALLATILAIPFTMFLKNRWHDALEVRLDFTGNLFSLLFLAMTFVEPIVQFFINVLVPSVFCPLVYFCVRRTARSRVCA